MHIYALFVLYVESTGLAEDEPPHLLPLTTVERLRNMRTVDCLRVASIMIYASFLLGYMTYILGLTRGSTSCFDVHI